MAMSNVTASNLNPSQLRPAGQPSTTSLGINSGEGGQTITQTPMQGPNGETYIMQQVGNTAPSFIQKAPDGSTIRYQPNGDGTYRQGQYEKRGFGEAVFGDKKLMTFAAIAAGGALAGSAYGTGGAGGSMLGGGTGATPGVVAGGTMGSSGLGAATGTGLLGTMGGTGSMSAGELAAMDAAGGAQAGTGLGAATGTGLLGTMGGNIPDVLRGVLGAGFGAWNANQQQQRMNEALERANQTSIDASRTAGQAITGAAGSASDRLAGMAGQSGQGMLAAGERAADMSTFRPYNVTGGLAGASFDGNTVTKTLDPRMRAIQDQSLSSAQGFLGSVNAGTPAQLAEQSYANYNKWAKPAQDQQFAGLQDRLAKQGMLGLNVNTGNLSGGGNVSVNPYYKDFAQGVALADLKNYENSIAFGQQTTANQIGMGNSMLGIGVGIDNLGNDAIKLGQSLGDSQAAAGARAGGFLTDASRTAGNWSMDAVNRGESWKVGAANNAAMLNHSAASDAAGRLMGRQQSEAYADAERNRAMWDSIWKTL